MITEAIAKYVKENRIKQSFICERTGLSKHRISHALTGKRKLSIDEYEKICKALNLPYQFFFEKNRKSA